MKIISLWQPWATLWASGIKRIETRHWPLRCSLPMKMAVHAAKRFTTDEQRYCLDPVVSGPLTALGYDKVGQLPLGCVVGIVTIERVYQFRSIQDIPHYPEAHFGDYTLGRWGWVTTGNRLLETPIPLIGRQGIFDWTPPADLRFAEGNHVSSESLQFGAIAASKPTAVKTVQPTLFDISEVHYG